MRSISNQDNLIQFLGAKPTAHSNFPGRQVAGMEKRITDNVSVSLGDSQTKRNSFQIVEGTFNDSEFVLINSQVFFHSVTFTGKKARFTIPPESLAESATITFMNCQFSVDELDVDCNANFSENCKFTSGKSEWKKSFSITNAEFDQHKLKTQSATSSFHSVQFKQSPVIQLKGGISFLHCQFENGKKSAVTVREKCSFQEILISTKIIDKNEIRERVTIAAIKNSNIEINETESLSNLYFRGGGKLTIKAGDSRNGTTFDKCQFQLPSITTINSVSFKSSDFRGQETKIQLKQQGSITSVNFLDSSYEGNMDYTCDGDVKVVFIRFQTRSKKAVLDLTKLSGYEKLDLIDCDLSRVYLIGLDFRSSMRINLQDCTWDQKNLSKLFQHNVHSTKEQREVLVGAYRALKQRYESEGNKPQSGDFHYWEQILRLKILQDTQKKTFQAHSEWFLLLLYNLCAGFGERIIRMFVVWVLVLIVPSVFLGAISTFRQYCALMEFISDFHIIEHPINWFQVYFGEMLSYLEATFGLLIPGGAKLMEMAPLTKLGTVTKIFFVFFQLMFGIQTALLVLGVRRRMMR